MAFLLFLLDIQLEWEILFNGRPGEESPQRECPVQNESVGAFWCCFNSRFAV